jgi:cell division protein ZipA
LWTYLVAADSDSVFSDIALAWKLFNERTPNPRPFSTAELTTFQQAVAQRAPAFSGHIVSVNYSPALAAAASQQLASFVAANNLEAVIILKADTLFEGREIWDKMRSLGLHWGDMDLFHWENPNTDAGGGDHLFSVFTSTEPGYFLPEHIAKGELKTTDLIFSFSIPRSNAPQEVLKNMYQAAKYCQQKLGGQLQDNNGRPFNLNKELKKCQKVTQNLAQQKLRPGYDDTLYLF